MVPPCSVVEGRLALRLALKLKSKVNSQIISRRSNISIYCTYIFKIFKLQFLFTQRARAIFLPRGDADLLHFRSVYAALEEHKPPLTAVGGRMPTVGVVGFLLGGGLSHLSPGYGFGADTVSVWEVSGQTAQWPVHR